MDYSLRFYIIHAMVLFLLYAAVYFHEGARRLRQSPPIMMVRGEWLNDAKEINIELNFPP